MPKIPKHLDETKAVPSTQKGICIACSGTGKSSRGGVCNPCNGTGIPYTWICPKCNARHDGFKDMICRNEKCPTHRLRSKK